MREAIGGTILLYIVLIFLFVYICFMGVVIHYGRVFRWKNTVVSIIEQYEGLSSDAQDLIKAETFAKGYHDGNIDVCYNEAPNKKSRYYNIRMYVLFELPLAGKGVSIPITGQTSGIPKLVKGASNDVDIISCDEGYSQIFPN